MAKRRDDAIFVNLSWRRFVSVSKGERHIQARRRIQKTISIQTSQGILLMYEFIYLERDRESKLCLLIGGCKPLNPPNTPFTSRVTTPQVASSFPSTFPLTHLFGAEKEEEVAFALALGNDLATK